MIKLSEKTEAFISHILKINNVVAHDMRRVEYDGQVHITHWDGKGLFTYWDQEALEKKGEYIVLNTAPDWFLNAMKGSTGSLMPDPEFDLDDMEFAEIVMEELKT